MALRRLPVPAPNTQVLILETPIVSPKLQATKRSSRLIDPSFWSCGQKRTHHEDQNRNNDPGRDVQYNPFHS
jgi:hypothetical protein